MRTVVCDIETESLNPNIVWVIACKEIIDGQVSDDTVVFERPDLEPEDFVNFAAGVDRWVGHNFLTFDRPVLNRLVRGCNISHKDVVDTLVVSRLLYYAIDGGHSLDAWGKRLGLEKPTLTDFSHLSPDMITRVKGDCELNVLLYQRYQSYIDAPEWQEALRTEHDIALVCQGMTEVGFYFDIDDAVQMHHEVSEREQELLRKIHIAFPPRAKVLREITPVETKHGTLHSKDFRWLDQPADLSPYSAGAKFTLIEFLPFNPGSPQQVVQRLNESGWKPTEKTKGHIKLLRQRPKDRDPEKAEHYAKYGWSVSETNLDTLPDSAPPAAHSLKDLLTLASRRRKLEEWFGVYNTATHSIHGQFLPIGAWTHRMAHHAPNMGNNVGMEKEYGPRMRAMWKARKGRKLVGTDMDQAHLRIFAHLVQDEEAIKAMAEGDKKTFTDIHSLNARVIGLDPADGGRKPAKNFIYTFLNGGQPPKIANMLNIPVEQARAYVKFFNDRYPGLKELNEKVIPKDAARGYFIGLDGRKVIYDAEHGMLAGYLQNGEAVMMKKANLIWRANLERLGIPFWQVNFVHDEWQTETIDEEEIVNIVQETQLDALREVGELYGVTCPIAGTTAAGYTWADTH